jgi:hypothetical protein
MVAESIPAALAEWCERELGAAPARELFRRRQTGEVTGLRLRDGRRVVVKARHDSLDRVNTCLAVQGALFALRYPCPRPITGATLLGGLTVHAEDFVDGGAPLLGSDVTTAAAFGASYAELVTTVEHHVQVARPDVLNAPPWLDWWRQRPWSDARLPETLVTAAAAVRERLAAVDLANVIGYGDWETQNLRFAGETLRVVFDWDSLVWLPEAVLVGAASGSFPSNLQPTVASIEASHRFVAAYESRRGRSFGADELEVVWAASLLPVLHNARNEVVFGRRPLILDVLGDQVRERLRRAGC